MENESEEEYPLDLHYYTCSRCGRQEPAEHEQELWTMGWAFRGHGKYVCEDCAEDMMRI